MTTNKLILLLSIFIALSVSQNTTMSVISDLEATYIDGSSRKRGENDEPQGRRTTVRLSSNQIGLVRFPMIFGRNGGPVPDDAEIVKATFTVTSLNNALNAVLFKPERSWSESSVHWQNYRNSISTSTANRVATLIYEGSQVVNADVTSYLKDLVDANFMDDFGWSIVQQGGSSSFYSEDESNSNVRPFLSVEWRCNDNNGCTTDSNAMMNGVCVQPTPVSCDDTIDCTNDMCMALGPWNQTCSHTEVDSVCDQGQRCTLQGCVGIPTTEAPALPLCVVGNLVCRCSSETEFDCDGSFNGTVILPQYEIIWTSAFVTTNTSIIIFGTNTTVILETCHDIKGSIQVDFQLERGEESVLVKHNDGCSLDDVDVIFNDGNCIKGRAVQRGTSLVAVFDNSCSGQTEGSNISVPMVVGIIVAIIVVIAILAFVFLYPPARAFVMPFSKQTMRTTPKEIDDDQL